MYLIINNVCELHVKKYCEKVLIKYQVLICEKEKGEKNVVFHNCVCFLTLITFAVQA